MKPGTIKQKAITPKPTMQKIKIAQTQPSKSK
jgi:hypothetical protein